MRPSSLLVSDLILPYLSSLRHPRKYLECPQDIPGDSVVLGGGCSLCRFKTEDPWTGGLRRGCLWCKRTPDTTVFSLSHCARVLSHGAVGICSPTLAVSGAPDFPWVRGTGIKGCQVTAGTSPSLRLNTTHFAKHVSWDHKVSSFLPPCGYWGLNLQLGYFCLIPWHLPLPLSAGIKGVRRHAPPRGIWLYLCGLCSLGHYIRL